MPFGTVPSRRSFLRALGAGSIGAATLSGFGSATGGSITIEAGGEDIWNQEDQFHFYYTSVEGDFDVTVHVDSIEDTDEWAKAGLMVRQELTADAENAMIRYTPGNDTSVQWRSDDGDETDSTTSDDVGIGAIEASWLRLVRDGETITAYGSTDGSDWTHIAQLDPPRIDFAEDAYVGLAVTSHDRGTLCSAEFDSLSGIDPGENGDIGDVAVSGSVSTDPDDGARTVEPGTYKLVSANSAKVLEVAGGSENHGATLQQWSDEGNANQHWEVEYLGDGEYRLTASHSGHVAEVADGSTDGGADVQQWPWAGYDNQRWRIEPADDDAYVLHAVHSGQAMDVFGASTDNGANVIQWPKHGGENQLWRFEAVEGDGGDDDDGGDVDPVTQFDPDSGFASTDWLDDDVDIYRIQDATRNELETALHASGPRIVVFETSGTIDLGAERLNVTEDNCWIAGQTAPSPGVTLIRGDINIDADNCVVQHIRVRPGDANQDVGWDPDSIRTGDGTENNVLDHVSASWSVDEISSPGYDSSNTTFTNCLFAEPLHDATHPKGEHGCGTLVGDGATNVALLGNLWAKAQSRQPRLKADTESVVVNNVMYLFDEATNLDDSTVATIEGNSYLRVDEDDSNIEDGRAYLADNMSDPDTEMASGTDELSSRPLWPDGLERLSPEQARDHVYTFAGARPADRTALDQRHVEEVQNRSGDYVDSQSEVGGYPSLPENEHSLDVPGTGLREWLQQWARAVESPDASPP